MVDFLYNSTGEEVEEDKKSQYLSDFTKENNDPLGLVSSVPDFDEFSLSFADSLLDFDDLRDLISDSPMADSKQEPIIELGSVEFESVSEKCEGQAEGSLHGVDDNSLKDGELGFKVEEELGRVSISETENERQADVGNVTAAVVISENEVSDRVAISSKAEERIVHGDELKGDKDVSNRDTAEESESESESQSSSSASSSDSDDKEEEDEDESSSSEEDMEEGEIVASDPDEMVNWDDNEETGVKGGPIRSKNEVQVLPPVPEVTATLQSHHQMQPVGVVSSIIGAQVVVEGVEKHSPLNDGSILWITESRSPLGIVDEIFGPVKNPYYIVRYNSDHEVPSGIHPGTLISFVPEFSNHILNANSLYKKGYDASGENDEETSDDEFSDDEKEAEYKRMLKMKKRGIMNDQKPVNKKKDKRNLKNRSQNWKHDQGVATDVQRENGEPSVDQGKHVIPTATAPLNQDIHQSASRQGHGQSIRSPSVPPLFPHMQNSPGLAGPSTGVWNNGIPFQQPQNMGFPNTLPNIGMPWHPQQIFQMPSSNAFPFQQQINPTLPSSFMFPGGLPNFGAGPSFGPWPAFGQNVFSQSPMAMGLPGQFTPSPVNLGGQVSANGPQSGQNNISQPNVVVPGYINGSPNFNQGQSPLPMTLPGQFTPAPPMNLGGQVPENGPKSGQNNNSQPCAMVPDFNNGSPNFNQGQSPLPMNLQGQFTPTPMNLGGQVPENGPKSGQNNNSQPRPMVPDFNNGSPNFNRGAHSGGGRRGNHRGGGRFNGRRGRSQRN